jgi:hypothetical protein
MGTERLSVLSSGFLERNWLECVRTAARRQSLTQADAVLAAVKARFAVAFGQP